MAQLISQRAQSCHSLSALWSTSRLCRFITLCASWPFARAASWHVHVFVSQFCGHNHSLQKNCLTSFLRWWPAFFCIPTKTALISMTHGMVCLGIALDHSQLVLCMFIRLDSVAWNQVCQLLSRFRWMYRHVSNPSWYQRPCCNKIRSWPKLAILCCTAIKSFYCRELIGLPQLAQ